jgi:hypothetical protein
MSAEFKQKKARAIENFKKVMSVAKLSGEEWKVVAMTVDKAGNPIVIVLSPDDILYEMEHESQIGLENIEIWSVDIEKELRKIEKKHCSC